MKAEIICVGTELLLGDIINTNAVFVSRELANLGIDVYHQSVVGDNGGRLSSVFKEALKRSEIVVITGGLGPTKDDLTKEVITKSLGMGFSLHLPWLSEIKSFFKVRNIKMPKNNIKQALIPRGSQILVNSNGTACGIHISFNSKEIFLLPGPPRELRPMFSQVVDILKPLSKSKLQSKVIKTYGIGESKIVELISDLIETQTDPTIAPLAKNDGVHLRLTTKTNLSGLNEISNEILDKIGDFVWGFDEDELNQRIIKTMAKNNFTLSLVESCTGGLIASTLTDVCGSSMVLLESQVLYTEIAKARFLNCHISKIPSGGIDLHLTEKLAINSRKSNSSTISLAITGALGPTSPIGVDIGEVYISVAYEDKVKTTTYNFSGSRENIKDRCVIVALHSIRETLGEILDERYIRNRM